MFEDVNSDGAVSLVARLEQVIDELQSLDWGSIPGEQLLTVLRDLETQKRRLTPVDHALIAEVDAQGLAHEHACRSSANLLSQLLRISPAEATGRVHAAVDLGPRRGLTGEVLPPLFEHVAAVQVEHEESVQAFLVEQAVKLDPTVLKQVARRIKDTLDPDGTLTEERDRNRRRDLTVRQRPDGSAHLEGELTAICTEALLTVLDALGRAAPAEDGTPDPRSAGQHCHDGFQDGLFALLRSGELPARNGVVATIVLTMTDQQIASRSGLATTGHGAQITVEQALTLFGDARIMPVVLTKTREIAAYGDAHRIFTEGQRLAMIARDQGCSFPGCTTGSAWCQAHHVTDFALTRRTSVDDGTLLCGFHHREHPAFGWTCRVINGAPHWTPPAWIDPDQTPRRNRVHDLVGI